MSASRAKLGACFCTTPHLPSGPTGFGSVGDAGVEPCGLPAVGLRARLGARPRRRLPRRHARRDRRRADLLARRRAEQLVERVELRVRGGDRLEQRDAAAGGDDHAAADRAVRVLGAEQRRARVVDPRGPEQIALLRALGVEGERVEQRVHELERAREPRRDRLEAGGRAAQRANGRAHVARERAQLVSDHRSGGPQERPRGHERRAEVARGRAERLRGGPELAGEGVGALEGVARGRQRSAGGAGASRGCCRRPPRAPGSSRWRIRRAQRAGGRACRARSSAARSCAPRASGSGAARRAASWRARGPGWWARSA